jgi:integrase
VARGSLQKRGQDSWRIRIYLGIGPDGRQQYHSETVRGTKKQAQQRMTEVLREIDTGGYVAQSAMPLAELLERWLTEWVAPNRSSVTVESYRSAMARIVPELGAIPVQKLRPVDLQSYYAHMLRSGRADGSGGLSPTSVHSHHRCLHAALAVAVKWGIVARNVADAVQPPQPKRSIPEPWNPSETRQFLETAAGHRLYAFYALAAVTGLRRGEICGLRWEDVDLDAGLLRVQQTIVYAGGKQYAKPNPKTEYSSEPLSISQAMVSVLRAHRIEQHKERLQAGDKWQGHGLVFCQPNGSPLVANNIGRDFAVLCRRAGVRRIRFHDLRHTYSAQLIDQGVPVTVVQRRLRHAKASTTMDMYGHAMPESERAAAELTDHLLPDERKQQRL